MGAVCVMSMVLGLESRARFPSWWMYLNRAVDERVSTMASHLSRRRDIAAAKAFFRKALKRHGEPRMITLGGFEPIHACLLPLGPFAHLCSHGIEIAFAPAPRSCIHSLQKCSSRRFCVSVPK